MLLRRWFVHLLLALFVCLPPLAPAQAARAPVAPAVPAATINVNAGSVDELTTNGSCSLREAIGNANSDFATYPDCLGGTGLDTIVLPAGVYTLTLTGANEDNNLTGDLDLTDLDGLTINGALSATTLIDAAGLDRVLHAQAGMLTLNNLTVQNGAVAGHGGGILATSGLGLTNTQVLSNSANVGQGGGVYATGATTFNGVQLHNNTASASSQLGGGAAVYGPLQVWNSAFINNTASATNSSAGGLYAASTAQVLNSTFRGNYAYTNGGGAHFGGATFLTNTVFMSNTAGTSYGGGIYAVGGNPIQVTQGLFQGNVANIWGGGAYFGNAAHITNTTFSANTANQGGGAYFTGNLSSITGTTFINNTASNNGGGAFLDNTIFVTGTRFMGNSADLGGGAYFPSSNGLKQITNALFARNQATSGGAIYAVYPRPLHILHTTVTSPTLANNQAIYVEGTTSTFVYLTNTIVTSHTIGIVRTSGGTVSAWNTLFYGNSTNTSGISNNAPVSGDPNFANPAVDDYHITAASAAIDAGIVTTPAVGFDIDGQGRPIGGLYDIGYDEAPLACYAEHTGDGTTDFSTANAQAVRAAVAAASPGATVKIAGRCVGVLAQGGTAQTVLITKALTLTGGYTATNWNTYNPGAHSTTLDAFGRGRVLSATNVAVTVRGLTAANGYLNSTLTQHGGGLYAAGAMTLTDLLVTGNTITGTAGAHHGGGVYIVGPAVISNTIFSNNHARTDGGGAAFEGPVTLRGSHFDNNLASNNGGGAAWGAAATATVHNVTFRNNRAANRGGGAYWGAAANVSTGAFINNTAPAYGGGAFFGQNAVLSATIFQDNQTTGSGGGAHFENTATLTNPVFQGNSAGFGGGVSFLNPYAREVVNALFARNRAFNNGAAVYVNDAAPLRLLHATIVSPTLAEQAAIYRDGGTVYVTNTLVALHAVGLQALTTTAPALQAWNTLFYSNGVDLLGDVISEAPAVGDPDFVSLALEDYHLGAASAAIDAGATPTPNVPFDIDGEGRPSATAPDIGYDEAAPIVYRGYLPLVVYKFSPILPLPITQNFETCGLETRGWVSQSATPQTWRIGGNNPLGVCSAYVPFAVSDQNERLFSPYFTTAPSSVTFATKGSLTYCGGAPGGNCDLKVWLVRGPWDGGLGDDSLLGYADQFWPSDYVWVTPTLPITLSLNGLPGRIAFQYIGNNGANAYVDNISILP